jgi:hypothetical protein
MKELIEIFRMTEISAETRARLIIKLGNSINFQFGNNLTEPVVFELVSILDPSNPLLSDKDFRRRAWVHEQAQQDAGAHKY